MMNQTHARRGRGLAVALGMAGALLVQAGAWAAEMTPVGTWRSIDDKTGAPKAQIVIRERGGALYGRIEKLLRPGADPHAVCSHCTDDRKDKPMVGLEIIRGARRDGDRAVWEDGKILDPESGRSYTLRLTPVEEGRRLQVRGSVFGIGRTQTWVRVH